jgi:predicted ATPase
MLRSSLGSARRELSRLLPGLDEGGLVGDPDEGRLFESLLDVLERLGEERPLVVVLEDLQWADPSTREVVAFLVLNVRPDRVRLLLTVRSEDVHRDHPLNALLLELSRHPRVERIELARLPREDVARLLEAILEGPAAEETLERMFVRSEGNPFLAEEPSDIT